MTILTTSKGIEVNSLFNTVYKKQVYLSLGGVISLTTALYHATTKALEDPELVALGIDYRAIRDVIVKTEDSQDGAYIDLSYLSPRRPILSGIHVTKNNDFSFWPDLDTGDIEPDPNGDLWKNGNPKGHWATICQQTGVQISQNNTILLLPWDQNLSPKLSTIIAHVFKKRAKQK